MQAHPLYSICIQRQCVGCERKRRRLDQTLKKLKEIIGGLNKTVRRMRKEERVVLDLDLDSESDVSEDSRGEAASGVKKVQHVNGGEVGSGEEIVKDPDEEFEMLSVTMGR
jgi:hypothetical protein